MTDSVFGTSASATDAVEQRMR
ncbi:MAG: hypothetical protein RJA72_1801, partial [Pseudomonadota bacterium]